MKSRRRWLETFLWLLVGIHVVPAQPQASLVSFTLDTNSVTVTAGAEFTVVANATIAAGWHINSNRPNEESLIPTRIDARGKSVTLFNVGYPKAEEIRVGISENPLSVFDNHCQFRLTFKTGAAEQGHSEEVAITLNYQACNDHICMPATDVRAMLLVNLEAKATRRPPD